MDIYVWWSTFPSNPKKPPLSMSHSQLSKFFAQAKSTLHPNLPPPAINPNSSLATSNSPLPFPPSNLPPHQPSSSSPSKQMTPQVRFLPDSFSDCFPGPSSRSTQTFSSKKIPKTTGRKIKGKDGKADDMGKMKEGKKEMEEWRLGKVKEVQEEREEMKKEEREGNECCSYNLPPIIPSKGYINPKNLTNFSKKVYPFTP